MGINLAIISLSIIISFLVVAVVLYIPWLILTIKRSSAEIEDLYNNVPCGYHSLDKDGVFVQINDTELSWLGCSRDELIGKKTFFDVLTPESSAAFGEAFPWFKETGWIKDAKYELLCADGTVKTILLSAYPVKDPEGKYVMSRAVLYDITERQKTEDALKKEQVEKEVLRRSHEHYRVLATIDSLTGLHNRHYFNDIIYRELDRADRYGEKLLIMMIDVDNFKHYNDTYGHQHGDGVLKECAAILNKSVRTSDILCRFGGDEFVIVMPGTDCTENNSVISRIYEHISEWNRQTSSPGYEMSLSIGCAVWESGKDLIEVMKEADNSMYENKRFKRDQINTGSSDIEMPFESPKKSN